MRAPTVAMPTAIKVSPKRRPPAVELRLTQAVRNSLNLPELQVQVRRSRERGSWRVCLRQGRAQSAWLALDSGAVAVIKKIGLLPPRLLGHFRLAYDGILQKAKS